MISREKASNLFRLAVLMLINLCIVCLAFFHTSPLPSSQPAVDVLSQYGSRGEEVSKIQTRLKSWGYFSGEVTGYYGSQTTEAVKRFQKKHGLSATGVADRKTLELIGISSSSSGASVSNADLELLARIISAEARGEPYIGQVAVGAVVLNRVESSSFPDSISGVIYQPEPSPPSPTVRSMKRSPTLPAALHGMPSMAPTPPAALSTITIPTKPLTVGFAPVRSSPALGSTCSAPEPFSVYLPCHAKKRTFCRRPVESPLFF